MTRFTMAALTAAFTLSGSALIAGVPSIQGLSKVQLSHAPASAPEGANFEQWAMIYDGVGHLVENRCRRRL